MDSPGMPIAVDTNLLVDFQLLDYERRHDLCEGDVTFKGFSYGLPSFCQKTSWTSSTKGELTDER